MIRILNLLFDAFAAAQKKRAEAAMERHEYVVQRNLELVRGNLVRIEDGRGMLVRVTGGSVWVTEEGDLRDRFVGAGSHFRVMSSGVTLISAHSRSTIALSPPYEHGFARLIKLWMPRTTVPAFRSI